MAGRTVYAALHLLDRQIEDGDGHLCGKVDDLELTVDEETGKVLVTAILSGPGVLARRLHRHLWGPWLEWVHSLISSSEGNPARIPFTQVADLDNKVKLATDHSHLATASFDQWVRDHVITHIPGSRHETP